MRFIDLRNRHGEVPALRRAYSSQREEFYLKRGEGDVVFLAEFFDFGLFEKDGAAGFEAER